MFRIRESNLNQNTVYIWVDGRIGDRELASFKDILDQYLLLDKRVVVNLAYLNHAGWEVKKFFQEIKDLVELVELPEHIKAEVTHNEKTHPES